MKSTNVILIVALLAISYSNAFEFDSLVEVQELKGSAYGNSLIETVSLSLTSGGSINDVQKLLDELLFKLNQDQISSDRAWEKLNKTLTDKINELKTTIEQLRVKIAALRREIADYKAKIAQGQKNVIQYNSQKNANIAHLASLKASRNRDAAHYRKSVEEHNDVLNAISAVLKELGRLVGSVSGKGKPVHVAENQYEKRDREFALKKSFVQITESEMEAQIFAELATTADQNALLKLVGYIKQLELNIKKSLNDDQEHETRSKSLYKQLVATLKADNEKLNKLIESQSANINTYTQRVAKLRLEVAANERLMKSKQTELELTIKVRRDRENQYLSDKAQRDQERVVIQKLIRIVKKRLDNMSKFLRSSTGAF